MSPNTNNRRDPIGITLYILYVLLLAASVVIIGKLVYFQVFWKPAPKIAGPLTPRSVVRTIEPVRGRIVDCNGRILAMSYPVYDIHMDCTVRKREFARSSDKGAELEKKWMAKAWDLSEGLASLLPGKSAAQYYRLICDSRAAGKAYVPICSGIDRSTLASVKKLPLFNEGPNKGGLIVSQRNIRKYPYGGLARRTIGFVRDNRSDVGNTHVGLEGRFDELLHGQDGKESMRISDDGRVRDFDSTYVKAVDGMDLRTTINIDFQEFADKALREQIKGNSEVEGACLVVMEVATGAIRAMVNLYRDPYRDNSFEEVTNLAIGRRAEPGSVFKTVTLLSVLSDGYIRSLYEKIPTNHGIIKGTRVRQDEHIPEWERKHRTDSISILDGFKISSNYVFAKLAVDHYGTTNKKRMQFIDRLYDYKLGEAFDFDIDGLQTPKLPPRKKDTIGLTALGYTGFGYNTMETPLHILTFYNAIAAKGIMWKPYLVDGVVKDGRTERKMGQSILNPEICTREVADSVTRALLAVTDEGTARVLKNAKCSVAGKTGTSFGTFSREVNGKTVVSYKDERGKRKYQGTFVGFFPAEDPQYTAICMVYSLPSLSHEFHGGSIPARAIKEVIGHIYDNSCWSEPIGSKGSVPEMDRPNVSAPAPSDGRTAVVPDFSSLGLMDALYLAENSGLKLSYSGMGHTVSQDPAAGKRIPAGATVKIELK